MDAMIDLDKEVPITLAELGTRIDRHYNTIYRWWKRGVAPDKSQPKRKVRLETIPLPSGRGTTEHAYRRFLEKLREIGGAQ